METTNTFDKNNNEIFVGNLIKYSDIEHNIIDKIGFVRFNGLANDFEVINEDIQSGNTLDNITNITLWQ